MATGTGAKARPLSPHLQIWRWGPGMTVSILHRVTGVGLTIFGIALLIWFLAALSGGPEAYAHFRSVAWADLGALDWSGEPLGSLFRLLVRVVLFGLTWAFFQHAASGIRHYVLDLGAGYELDTNNRWATATLFIAPLLTVLFWAVVLMR